MKKERLALEDVIKKSWDVYKKNLGMLLLIVLLGIILISIFMVPGMIAAFVSLGGSFNGQGDVAFSTFSIVGIVIFCVTIILAVAASIVYGAAIIKGVGFAESGEKVDAKKAFLVAYQKFWLILGTSIIAALLIFVGLILLIIPGLVLAIYFQFILYVVIFEDRWGMDAIKRSYEIVKGNFWWLVLIILLVAVAQGLINWIPVFGGIIALILTPFWQVIMYVVYKDLKGLKGASEQK